MAAKWHGDAGAAGGPPSVPPRSAMREEDTWDLRPLYADESAWEADFARLQERYGGIGRFRGRLGESASVLAECLEFEKELSMLVERLNHYAGLRAAEDLSEDAAVRRESRMQALVALVGEAAAFLVPEIQALSDERFAEYLEAAELSAWRNALGRIRRFRPHTLSAAEERLMALGWSAWRGYGEVFSQLTNVDMRFGSLADDEGVERPLSQSAYGSFMVQRDPAVRRRAFAQFYAEFSEHRHTLAAMLAASVRADVFEARARGYGSAREAALFPDAVPVAVYDSLIAAVRSRLGVLHRYYELRKRVLGLPEIRYCDTHVPLVAELKVRVPFDEAVGTVLGSLAPLGEEYARVLGEGLRARRWCDRYESKGKRSGAFSSGSYGNPPYILMNYKEDVFSDVYTLAHEAGHSMHTWYAQRAQPFQDYSYPIFLAEVASTFNEELLTGHLLATTDDPRMRAYIVNRQVDDLRGTLFRQTMFAEFEKEIHAMEEAGEPPTLDAFRSVYRRLLADYLGPGFTIEPELELECLRIPHFYSAFYVYKYATGLAAAVALADRVRAGGDGAARYLGFLASGASKYPLDALRDAGVDMAEPAAVEGALSLFERRVGELEELLAR